MLQDEREISILLVEDDDVDAMAVERGFRKLRLPNPIYRARNGKEALDLLRRQPSEVKRPFIILLDLNMPIMGGIEFLQALRSDEKLKTSVVFVLTTSDADSDLGSAYNQNVAGYVVKSNLKEGFVKVIEMLDYYWKVVALPQ